MHLILCECLFLLHTDFNGISFPVLSDAVLGLNVNYAFL